MYLEGSLFREGAGQMPRMAWFTQATQVDAGSGGTFGLVELWLADGTLGVDLPRLAERLTNGGRISVSGTLRIKRAREGFPHPTPAAPQLELAVDHITVRGESVTADVPLDEARLAALAVAAVREANPGAWQADATFRTTVWRDLEVAVVARSGPFEKAWVWDALDGSVETLSHDGNGGKER